MSDHRALVIALGAGIYGAIQPKVNAVLADRVDSALLASLVNFSAAFVAVLVLLALRPQTRHLLWNVRSWGVAPWTLTAGLGGALVVLSAAISVSTIGVAIFSVAFFAGQIVCGLFVDRFGISPGGLRPATGARLQASVVAIAAVAVTQIGRPAGEFAPLLVSLVIIAGAASAFQAAFNGRIAATIGDAMAATSVNVTVGLTALAATVGILFASGGVEAPSWPSEPWLYSGGFLGAAVVLSLAVSTRAVGVLRATLAMLAAQLFGAFVIDWLIDDVTPSAGVIVGTILIVVAVALVGRGASETRSARA